jgi:hypothetical protein
MVVCLWGFEEVYLRYLFRFYVLTVSSCVCVFMMTEEMDFMYPSALYKWLQFVLAKNLPKGEIVGYLYWLHYFIFFG